MSDDSPPPLPQTRTTPPVKMAPRWICWLLASVIMPALPWMSINWTAKDDSAKLIGLTALALLLQLGASISVAIGFSKQRALGVGGVIGMTIVFMIASGAIGTAIWFAVCGVRMVKDFGIVQ